MEYTPITPFRRPVDAAILHHRLASEADLPPQGVNKWEALRELSAARIAFGLSDRDLSVLQALVSFHPATILGGNDNDLVVHPSNKAICERLNGMPCSTMRRHLSHLVQAGFVIRRDSPNGKRYARRYGDEKVSFGFDLAPLVRRHVEVCEAAEEIRAAEERYKRLRSRVSLMRRDLAGLASYGKDLLPELTIWDQFSDLAILAARDLRRKLDLDDLRSMEALLLAALDKARDIIDTHDTEIMSTNDALNEHHHHNSNKDSYELEPCQELAGARPDVALTPVVGQPAVEDEARVESDDRQRPRVPLGLVLQACPEILTYSHSPVRHWHDLVRLANIVRPMMGISPSAWNNAVESMGPEEASVVVAAILERMSEITSPGGYLRALTTKAAADAFSCGPMVMALLRRDAA